MNVLNVQNSGKLDIKGIVFFYIKFCCFYIVIVRTLKRGLSGILQEIALTTPEDQEIRNVRACYLMSFSWIGTGHLEFGRFYRIVFS